MKIATYRWGGRRHVGQLTPAGDEIVPLALERAQDVGALALIELMAANKPLPGAAGMRLPLSAVELEAPLPRPRRNLFCVGRNYRAHAQELAGTIFRGDARPIDEWPMIFSKVPECVIAHKAPIRLPRNGATPISEQIDYEAELAVVIGRGGLNIARARAMDHVWGYTIVNDVTARDVQTRHNQWHLGKSFDTFCPMGPWLADANDVDGRATRVRCWVNGELRQDAPTTDLIFDIPTLIETISRGITLYPGDVIATGTPAGVGMGMNPPQWLRSGDRVRIEIDGIGVLENPVQ
ncbi:MAG TPA: fumarylacetoacetate hydrolase family protein [Burkholderiaceae bacterium]|nr:fumarylacetoacetate hydrolase family protein [Burkholderiaceae bacterium]